MACNKESIAVPESPLDLPAVNEATETSVPVRLHIFGGVATKAASDNPKESELANTRLTIQAWGASSMTPAYTKTYDLGEESDIIVNMEKCNYAYFIVESGEVTNGEFQKTLEGQKEHLYATGKIKVEWESMQSQDAPFEILIARQINKISIEKILVNWSNPNYDSRQLKIKKIYLSDVPRSYSSNCNSMTIKGYNSSFNGTKEDIRIYNFGGLEGISVKCNNDDKYYMAPVYRLDNQLVDEVDAVISKTSPYTNKHVFYSYISNSTKQKTHIETASPSSNYVNLYVPMTTIVVEAEFDGKAMFYRFPISAQMDTAPSNTHIRIRELCITELGSDTLHGAKTYENFSFTFTDWTEEEITEPITNL